MQSELTRDGSSELDKSESLAQRLRLAPGQILDFVGSASCLQHPQVVFDAGPVDHLLENVLPNDRKHKMIINLTSSICFPY